MSASTTLNLKFNDSTIVSFPRFARTHGICYQTLRNWRVFRKFPVLIFDNRYYVDLLAGERFLSEFAMRTSTSNSTKTILRHRRPGGPKADKRNKELISAYQERSPFVTYELLGKEFGITRERVRQILRSYGVDVDSIKAERHKQKYKTRICKMCKTKFEVSRLVLKGSSKICCSAKCRSQFLRKEYKCKKCGKSFIGYKHKQRPYYYQYCSHKCWRKVLVEQVKKKFAELRRQKMVG